LTSDFQTRLEAALGGTHAVIDLDRYAANVRAMRERVGPDVELMAVVKANAYGHGMVPCARTALDAGARWLAVARIEEGLLLRANGIVAPVLVIGPPNPFLLQQAIDADISLAAGTREIVAQIAAAAAAASRPARVHLKIETGLHRYGIERTQVQALARAAVDDPRMTLEGIYTHFASADEIDDDFLDVQLGRFEETWRALRLAGVRLPFIHAANSAAALRRIIPRIGDDTRPIVRAGYALYGLSPSAEVPAPPEFQPILTLKSRVARVFTLPAGEGISYNRTFMTERPLRCATLPIGYGDGLFRALSNRGWAVVNGARCPIRGRVAMDQTVIEVEAAPHVAIGDESILIGEDEGAMTVDITASLCQTIGYEIVTALSERLPRVYLRHGQPIAVSDLLGLVEPEPDESAHR
jgi:alanine racemase